MPGYRAHGIVGMLVASVLTYALIGAAHVQSAGNEVLQWYGCALIGAFFPDIDTKSKGQLFLYKVFLLLSLFAIVQKNFVLLGWIALLSALPLIGRHRGLTHSFLFLFLLNAALLCVVAVAYPAYLRHAFYCLLFFGLGVASHIALDRIVSRF